MPLQGYAEAQPTRQELLAKLHVRDGSGGWSHGGAAALRIAAAVPVLQPLALLGHLPGVPDILDVAYRAVADNRQTISRVLGLESCAVHLRTEAE